MIDLDDILGTLMVARAGLVAAKSTIDGGLGVSVGGRYDLIKVALARVDAQIKHIYLVIEEVQLQAQGATDGQTD